MNRRAVNRKAPSEAIRPAADGVLQRTAVKPAPLQVVSPDVLQALHSPGRPLDAKTRLFMESRFVHDFSGVRVHTDAQAAESAHTINALAYTVGQDLVFGQGRYAPGTQEGRRLLAHELTHVVQQRGHEAFTNEPLHISTFEPAEAEARSNAGGIDAADSIKTAPLLSPPQIQREVMGGEDDPIHRDMIEEWRKRHGFPPHGKDSSGNQVGPTDAEIKYGGLLTGDRTADKPSATSEAAESQVENGLFGGSLARLRVDRQGKILGWNMDQLARQVGNVADPGFGKALLAPDPAGGDNHHLRT